MKNFFKIVFGTNLILFVIFLVLIMPFGVIWSLNNLFELGIGYTWRTWLAVVFLNLYYLVKIPKKS